MNPSPKQLAAAAKSAAFLKIRYEKPGEPPTIRFVFAERFNAEKQNLAATQIHPDPGKKSKRTFSAKHIVDFKEISTDFPVTGRKGACTLLEDLDPDRLHYLRSELREEIDDYKTEWVLQMPGDPNYVLELDGFAYAYSLNHAAGNANIGVESKGELREGMKLGGIDNSQVEFVKAREWAQQRLMQVENLLNLPADQRTKFPRRKKTTKTAATNSSPTRKRTVTAKSKSTGCLFVVLTFVVVSCLFFQLV